MVDKFKSETTGYKIAYLTRELSNLDCLVCADLRLKGTLRGLIWHCSNDALLVRMRLRGQIGKPPKWCPRKKILKREIEEMKGE